MSNSAPDQRPGLAILSSSITPYRVNLHRLIAERIAELRIHTLITHGQAEFRWQIEAPADIHVVHFGAAGESALDATLRRPWAEWRKGGRLIRYLRQNDIRAVICNGHRYLSFLRLIDYCSRNAIPLFVRNDSNIRSERRLSRTSGLLKQALYAWWLRRASGVMAMGALGDEFFLKYGANRQHLYRVPYWPDYDHFARVDEDDLARFLRKYGLEEGRRRILYSGRLVPIKRVDLLIDAFAAVAAERPNWDLLIVGDGALGDKLRGRVPESIGARVALTGFLDGPEAQLAYHAADVLVLPSDYEPWAVVIQEAMAAGQVVVASDVCGAAHELVDDGKSGRIFPVGNLTELKRAVLDVTRANALAGYKERSTAALRAWRQRIDPVAEIRRALTDFGVLGQTSGGPDAPQKSVPACTA